ncbi:DUF262 domain-containing protein [Chloroflexota bacterium]
MIGEVKIKEGTHEPTVEEIIPFQYSITSYGADYPVDGLVKRIKNGDIYVPPFQRPFVWTLKTSSRFIESLLLGLPVPGIFLSRDEDTKRLVVIDGQQRLRTLQYFYTGIFHDTKREFALYKCESRYEGVTYRTLTEEDRRRLDDSIIHATIVKQDEPTDDYSSIFHIFERLNTGGTLLGAQEIRNALFQGEFNDLIVELNNSPAWRRLFGRPSSRFRDCELIIRFLALYFHGDLYKPPMKEFLNKYMGSNKHLQKQNATQIKTAFIPTIDKILDTLGSDAFKPRGILIAAIYDAVMVGVTKRLEKGDIYDAEPMKERYAELIGNNDFINASSTHTTDEKNVITRIKLAIEAFQNIT